VFPDVSRQTTPWPSVLTVARTPLPAASRSLYPASNTWPGCCPHLLSVSVWAGYVCWGRVTTIWMLQNSRSLSFWLEARGLKSRCQQGRALTEGSREGRFLSPPALVASGLWDSLAGSCPSVKSNSHSRRVDQSPQLISTDVPLIHHCACLHRPPSKRKERNAPMETSRNQSYFQSFTLH
jgi:hypothetical protein